MKSFPTVLISGLILAAASAPAQAADSSSSDDSSWFNGDVYVGFSGRIEEIAWKNKSFSGQYAISEQGDVTRYDFVDSEGNTSGALSAKDFPETLMGVGLHLGYRFSPYLAAELGYDIAYDENRIMDNDANRLRYRMSVRQWQLDAYAFWPLGDSGRFRPFLTAGLAYASGDARLRSDIVGTDEDGKEIRTMTYSRYFQKHEIDWRAGTGIEVGLSQDVAARIFARYQPYSFGALKGGVTFGFDLNVAVY